MQTETTDSNLHAVFATDGHGDTTESTNDPYRVVFLGIYGYGILGTHDRREDADADLAEWQRRAVDEAPLRVPGWTRHAVAHDFDVRRQSDLDALTRAIRQSYEETIR